MAAFTMGKSRTLSVETGNQDLKTTTSSISRSLLEIFPTSTLSLAKDASSPNPGPSPNSEQLHSGSMMGTAQKAQILRKKRSKSNARFASVIDSEGGAADSSSALFFGPGSGAKSNRNSALLLETMQKSNRNSLLGRDFGNDMAEREDPTTVDMEQLRMMGSAVSLVLSDFVEDDPNAATRDNSVIAKRATVDRDRKKPSRQQSATFEARISVVSHDENTIPDPRPLGKVRSRSKTYSDSVSLSASGSKPLAPEPSPLQPIFRLATEGDSSHSVMTGSVMDVRSSYPVSQSPRISEEDAPSEVDNLSAALNQFDFAR